MKKNSINYISTFHSLHYKYNTSIRQYVVENNYFNNISPKIKEKLKNLAQRYDRTTADMVRALLNIGIPIMEGISEAEEKMIKEYMHLFRKFRKIKNLKEI